ncbi:MAG: DUF1360 domain-containing protein [Planctomycetota bacterium]|jgi:uncharacterized membrane-anchored protein
MENLLILGLAVAATSMTITKAHICESVRERVSRLGPWFKSLIHCPWCVSHWLALVAVPFWLPELSNPAKWLIYTMSVVAISGVVSAGIAYLFLALDALEGE